MHVHMKWKQFVWIHLPVTCTNSSTLMMIFSLTCTQRSGSNSNDWTFGSYLSCKKSRGYADLSTKVRARRTPQKTIEGVVHLQPRLHAPVDSLPTLIVIVTFPVTYSKVVVPRLPPLQSTIVAPQTKHLQDVQRVRMESEALPFVVPLPDCPRVQAAFCAGLLHPEGPPSLYQVWPWGCVAHSGRNPQIASFAERGSPLIAGQTSFAPWLAVLVASNACPTEGVWFVWSHQTFRVIIPLTEAKANPLHSALRTDYACSLLSSDELRRIYVEGRPVKALEGGWTAYLANPPLLQRDRRLARMRQEFAEYHAGKQARKQEKLAYTMEARFGGTWFVKVFRHHFWGRGFGVLIGQRWFLVGARVWLHEASNGPCVSVLTLGFCLQVVRWEFLWWVVWFCVSTLYVKCFRKVWWNLSLHHGRHGKFGVSGCRWFCLTRKGWWGEVAETRVIRMKPECILGQRSEIGSEGAKKEKWGVVEVE